MIGRRVMQILFMTYTCALLCFIELLLKSYYWHVMKARRNVTCIRVQTHIQLDTTVSFPLANPTRKFRKLNHFDQKLWRPRWSSEMPHWLRHTTLRSWVMLVTWYQVDLSWLVTAPLWQSFVGWFRSVIYWVCYQGISICSFCSTGSFFSGYRLCWTLINPQ